MGRDPIYKKPKTKLEKEKDLKKEEKHSF